MKCISIHELINNCGTLSTGCWSTFRHTNLRKFSLPSHNKENSSTAVFSLNRTLDVATIIITIQSSL